MKLTIVADKIICCTTKTQAELNHGVVRLQEFYESPYEEICGKVFTVKGLMQAYRRHNKKCEFTYWDDWSGNNIPGDVVRKFYHDYHDVKLNKFELQLKLFLQRHNLLDSKKKFYFIACSNQLQCALVHEFAHACYYLFPSYKKKVDSYVRQISDSSIHDKTCTELKKMGYADHVLKDEMQAYYGTDTLGVLLPRFDITPKGRTWEILGDLQIYIHDFMDRKFPDHNFW